MEATQLDIAYDQPASWLSEVVPSNGDGSQGVGFDLKSSVNAAADILMGAEQNQAIRFECLLIVVDSGGWERAALTITFRDRKVSSTGAEIVGSDPSGAFRLVVRSNPAGGEMTLNVAFEPQVAGADPVDLLRALETYRALGGSHSVGIWINEVGSWAAPPIILPSQVPALPQGCFRGYASLPGSAVLPAHPSLCPGS